MAPLKSNSPLSLIDDDNVQCFHFSFYRSQILIALCSMFTIGNFNFSENLVLGRESEKSFQVFAKTKLFFLLLKYSSHNSILGTICAVKRQKYSGAGDNIKFEVIS